MNKINTVLRGFQINGLRTHPYFKKMDESRAIEILEIILNDSDDHESIHAFCNKNRILPKGWSIINLIVASNEVLYPEKYQRDKQLIYPAKQFAIKGESMNNDRNDAIIDSDIVTVGEIDCDYWIPRVLINRRRPCLIETIDGRGLIGNITRCGLDRFYVVRLNPDKEKYPNFWISRSQVKKVYQVFRITRDMERLSQREPKQ